MKHLSRIELLQMVEDPDGRPLPPERMRHVERCAACQADAGALRATLVETQQVGGGEPSPLFWDHFATRVSVAIADEWPAVEGRSGPRWFGGAAAAWSIAGVVVVLGMTTVAWRATLHAPAGMSSPAPRAEARDEHPSLDDLDADEAWTVVRIAADALQWDDTQAAVIGAATGAAERVATELTDEERAELARLLESELKRSGA
jgi:hypothetical protein